MGFGFEISCLSGRVPIAEMSCLRIWGRSGAIQIHDCSIASPNTGEGIEKDGHIVDG